MEEMIKLCLKNTGRDFLNETKVSLLTYFMANLNLVSIVSAVIMSQLHLIHSSL